MRNAQLSRLVLNGAVGFAIALAIWITLAGPYAQLLASVAQTTIRMTERPAITRIVASETLLVIHRTDIRQSSTPTQLAVESRDITFNFILLMTLFAASASALSNRNLWGLLGACAALLMVHAAAVVSFVKADYALNYGEWSASHYGELSRSIWTGAPFFYSVVGAHAFAFALWWLLRDVAPPDIRKTSHSKQAAARHGQNGRGAVQH